MIEAVLTPSVDKLETGSGAIPVATQRRQFITEGECWYAEPESTRRVDILRCLQLPSPLLGARVSDFHTIWIDLAKQEDDLLKEMNKTTRNEVRRASGENLMADFWQEEAASQAEHFCRFFTANSVVSESNAEIGRWLKTHGLHQTLALSRISDGEGRVLVWHAYYRDRRHARLKYSVSLARQENAAVPASAVGRANRYLHWLDILRFRSEGLQIYDLGGWYPGTEDEKLLRINQFKEGFGGQVQRAFHCTLPLTVKGRFYLWAADLHRATARWRREHDFSNRKAAV